jgi:hypothetical protein
MRAGHALHAELTKMLAEALVKTETTSISVAGPNIS